MPVEEVIVHNLGRLFGGMELLGVHAFRVTRNAELERHEEEADDLLDMISDELRERRFAPFVRLEVDAKMPSDLAEFLAAELDLNYGQDVYRMEGLVEQYDLLTIPDSPHKLENRLKYAAWSPATHPRLKSTGKRQKKHSHKRVVSSLSNYKEDAQSIFSVLREGDLLVHHPYQGFTSSTQRFVEEAAEDPHVLAIKATLYRTTSKSPIISALLKAKENGKHVAVLVELKARFDEARNVSFAQRLEEAGCNIAYGLVGVKTHAKTTLVVRRERSAPNGLRCYCHIGTGNYNPKTAKVYTDFGLLTCDPDLSSDVVDLFKLLTGLHSQAAVGGYKKLVVASEYMRQHFYKLIDREIENASKGKQAAICVKVNGLDDQETVLKLYEACKAGVRVDAIVRGICRLRPRVPGVSDNMRVVSTVGRFLEHSRVFCFYNDGKPLYLISSADWRKRNLVSRVEVASPIEDERLKAQLRDILALCLYDTKDAWEMMADGRWVPYHCAKCSWLHLAVCGVASTHPGIWHWDVAVDAFYMDLTRQLIWQTLHAQ
ncbi:unnamed protein product [Ostreobium quekettii]|uniref:Polyphosphate kinase n=1 Tax=Ostreobium quekettii TaxID=121088 RepID=A0A8S1IVG7_9CHLO|nr:unnamed protein product [Ostreobium quekettii]